MCLWEGVGSDLPPRQNNALCGSIICLYNHRTKMETKFSKLAKKQECKAKKKNSHGFQLKMHPWSYSSIIIGRSQVNSTPSKKTLSMELRTNRSMDIRRCILEKPRIVKKKTILTTSYVYSHPFKKKQARPGKDASGLCLCVS